MLSANHGLHMGLLSMEMDMWWSRCVSCMIFYRNKLNRMGESEHPQQTLGGGGGGGGGGGFFFACKDLGRMFDNPFPACTFSSFFKLRLACTH